MSYKFIFGTKIAFGLLVLAFILYLLIKAYIKENKKIEFKKFNPDDIKRKIEKVNRPLLKKQKNRHK